MSSELSAKSQYGPDLDSYENINNISGLPDYFGEELRNLANSKDGLFYPEDIGVHQRKVYAVERKNIDRVNFWENASEDTLLEEEHAGPEASLENIYILDRDSQEFRESTEMEEQFITENCL